MKSKRMLAALLAWMMLVTTMSSAVSVLAADTVEGAAAVQAAAAEFEKSVFAQDLEALYIDPDRVYSSDVRWWLGEAAYTDETLLEEIQALYDAGFRGVELCMQSDSSADDQVYAYGSEMWAHKWRLMMNKLLDLDMGVYLTSGTHWATSNVPGLNPDSQAAMQVIAMSTEKLSAGAVVTELKQPDTMRASGIGEFIGAYAYKLINEEEKTIISQRSQTYTSYAVDVDSILDLAEEATITQGATIYDQAIDWTAPDDGEYIVFAFWTHGNYKTASPAAETCYATNYFDTRGVEALREFWEANYLNDPDLNAKILEGDVQLFMDSLEISTDGGITWWSEDMREEFLARKDYDILPYMFLINGLPQVQAVYNPYFPPAEGHHDIAGDEELREKIVNDWVDVLTQLYCENMLIPLKEWLNSVGIKTRAQISYGRSIEITEPSMYVDYPEAENYNQYNNVDILRLHTAGAKLQNKVLSTETGAELPPNGADTQMLLRDAYYQYAAGFQRIIWHVWSTTYGYDNGTNSPASNYAWPGYANTNFFRHGKRTPTFRDYDEFNAHLGRVQQLLQTGSSRTDVGFIHNNWNQGVRFGGSGHSGLGGGAVAEKINGMNYMLAHQGVYYRSTELQDNGYTYDYFSPKFLYVDNQHSDYDVYFDEATKTIEPAGYRAIVLYQDWLDLAGAEKILEWAEKGLPVVIMDGAAVRTPFSDDQDAELAEVIAQLKLLPNVSTAEIYTDDPDFNYFKPLADGYDDGLYEALQELGVRPYAEYAQENHQLLSQSRTDDDGNLYLYLFNYCSNDYHQYSYIESVQHEDHGTNIQTEVRMDGRFVPYAIDAWSGEVTELASYRYENGQTVFAVDLDYGNIALYAFEAIAEDDERLHVVSTEADDAYIKENGLVVRATKTGLYDTKLSDGGVFTNYLEVPQAYDITGWNVTVESWTANPVAGDLSRTETIGDVTTLNRKTSTVKTDINVALDKLTTWNNIPEVGKDISGLGRYEASFNWDAGKADGAYLDFGDTLVDSMKLWINGVKVGGDVSTNPTKVRRSVDGIIDGEPVEGQDLYSGGINWTKPVVDISPYLQDGPNDIVIEYSSTQTNAMLASGTIRVTINRSGWWGNTLDYRAYGPSQAVIVPFVEQVIPPDGSSTVEPSLSQNTLNIATDSSEKVDVTMGSKAIYAEIISGDTAVATVSDSYLTADETITVYGAGVGKTDITVNWYEVADGVDAQALLVELNAASAAAVKLNDAQAEAEAEDNSTDIQTDGTEDDVQAQGESDKTEALQADEESDIEADETDAEEEAFTASQLDPDDDIFYNLSVSQTVELDGVTEDKDAVTALDEDVTADNAEAIVFALQSPSTDDRLKLLKSDTIKVTVMEEQDIEYVTVRFMDGSEEIAPSVQVKKGMRTGAAQWPANPQKSGYNFTGWYTAGGTLYTYDTTVEKGVMDGVLTLYAGWQRITTPTTPGGGSSRGGGNGGSSGGPNTGTVPSWVTGAISTAIADVSETTALAAVDRAVSNGSSSVRFQNPGAISLSTMKAMATQAGGRALTIHADSMHGNAVDVRLYVKPAQATADISLAASTRSTRATAVKELFAKWFSNNVSVVSLEQVGSFGQEIEVAVKLDETLAGKELVLYSYNRAANSYSRLSDQTYRIDANGYIHFVVAVGGDYVISDGTLQTK